MFMAFKHKNSVMNVTVASYVTQLGKNVVYIKFAVYPLQSLKSQAAAILGSVDFLGNPLGLFNDVTEGLSGLISEGNVGGLLKNVAHGVSNSTAKVSFYIFSQNVVLLTSSVLYWFPAVYIHVNSPNSLFSHGLMQKSQFT